MSISIDIVPVTIYQLEKIEIAIDESDKLIPNVLFSKFQSNVVLKLSDEKTVPFWKG